MDRNGVKFNVDKPQLVELPEALYDLRRPLHRLYVFKFFLNAIRFYHGCDKKDLYPLDTLPYNLKPKPRNSEKSIFTNLREVKQTGGVNFVKTFKDYKNYPYANFENLLKLYKILSVTAEMKENSNNKPNTRQKQETNYTHRIRHTYKNFSYRKFGSTIEVESKYCEENCLTYLKSARDVKKLLIHVNIFIF